MDKLGFFNSKEWKSVVKKVMEQGEIKKVSMLNNFGDEEDFIDDVKTKPVVENLSGLSNEGLMRKIRTMEIIDPDKYETEVVNNDIDKVYKGMSDLVAEKNRRYGNSVMEPIGIFTNLVSENNSESLNGILIRLGDKLKRIKNAEKICNLRKNDVSDLIGYLSFLCVEQGWTEFEDLID